MIKVFKVDKITQYVISRLCKGPVIEEEFIEQASNERLEKRQVELCIDALKKQGIVYEVGESGFEEGYAERFKRQLMFLSELVESQEDLVALQNKLKNAVVTVLGVGGIGTWVVNGLSQIGIGEIRIVDYDTVELSNLNRQLLFTSKDIGKAKVDVIRRKLPDARIKIYKKKITKTTDLRPIIAGSNIVVNCADNPSIQETTRILARYCEKLKIPYTIAGGYNMHLGLLGPIIIPGETACFDCFLRYQEANDPLRGFERIKDIEQTGSLAPIAGMVSNFHVMEIFKYLTGKGTINKNKFAEFNFMDFSISWRVFDKRKDCPTCGTLGK